MSDDSSSRFQVLAIDGGGLKGVFAAAALAHLENDFETRIVDRFDLIAGTSTGGLIALALAHGMTAQEVLEFYLRHQDTIFPPQRLAYLRRLRRPYEPAPLDAALTEVFGDATLGDSPVRLVIPSFDQMADDVHVFRTPHLPKLRRDHRVPTVAVARATTAAPSYLPAYEYEGHRLIDGGVWANNPSMCGVVEAIGLQGGPSTVHLLNVGTTSEVKVRPSTLDNAGWLRWAPHAVEVVLRGQALAAYNHAKLLLPDGHAVQLNVPVPAGRYRLDRVDADELRGRASSAARHASPKLAEFFTHTPAPYVRAVG